MKTGIESKGLGTYSRRQALREMTLGAIAIAAAPLAACAKPLAPPVRYWDEERAVRADVRWYVRRYYDYAAPLWEKCHIPVWGTMAVAILESAVGESDLAIGANNHFGIKTRRGEWDGALYYKETGRGPNDEVAFVIYRSYLSVEAGYRDFGEFLKSSRYDALRRCGLHDFERWCYALQEAGYASDEHYAEKLIVRIRDHHLDDLNRWRPEPVNRA